MSLQQRRMLNGGDKALSQANELTTAMDMAQSGDIGFGKHHFSVFAYGGSVKEVEHNVSQCYSEMINANIVPVREKLNLQD